MGTRFNIAITATDAATARIKAIKESIRQIVKPIGDVGSSVKALGKEVGVGKLASGLQNITKIASTASKSIAGVGGALVGAIGVGSVSALAIYSKNWLNAESATMRFAATSGVAATKVQVLEGAAKLAGLKAEDMDGAIQSLGTTLQDARWGRNQGALMMMNRLGVQLKYTKEGAVDTVATLGDLADILGPGGRLSKAPVQTKALVAQQFGVEALLPILLQGRKALEDYERQAAKAKPPLTDAQLKQADEYRQSIDALGLSFDNLGNKIMTSAMPALTAVGAWIARGNNNAAANIEKNGFWKALGMGAATTAFDVATFQFSGPRKPQKASPRAEQESIDDFKRMGWSDAQAKGIVANMIAESGLDPKAVGDGGAAKGALQWHDARQRDYRVWAASQPGRGQDVTTASLGDQRAFINYELREGREQRAGRDLAATDKADQAAAMLSREYVRPKDAAGAAAQRAATAADLDKNFPGAGSVVQGDGKSLESLWKDSQKRMTSESTINLNISGLPSGAKAEVVDKKGPVNTVLKVDSSMPDYSLQ